MNAYFKAAARRFNSADSADDVAKALFTLVAFM
jgi:hypothetical protein